MSEPAMRKNGRFIAHGAIVGLVFLTIISSLGDISRLLIVLGLCALSVAIERRR